MVANLQNACNRQKSDFGLYEAHVEGMWPSNSMLIG